MTEQQQMIIEVVPTVVKDVTVEWLAALITGVFIVIAAWLGRKRK